MDSTVALAAAAVSLSILIFLLNYLRKNVFGGTQTAVQAANEDAAEVVQPQRRALVARNARARLRAAQRQNVREDAEDEPVENDEAAAEVEDYEEEDLSSFKVGKKKLAKLEAKAEKRAAREAEEREREERKKREAEMEEERKKKEEQEKQKEIEQAEREQREREEKERREYEEYLQMKAAFSVEEEGYDAEADESKEKDLLNQFINHVKETKIVLLEDLAAKFQLKTQDAIDRLQRLVKEGQLTGVIDDRGKFIYISMEELEAVAKFIRQRGRVSLTELAENSNKLINLEILM
nr:EOG090X0N9E [Eulimnadia texana]